MGFAPGHGTNRLVSNSVVPGVHRSGGCASWCARLLQHQPTVPSVSLSVQRQGHLLLLPDNGIVQLRAVQLLLRLQPRVRGGDLQPLRGGVRGDVPRLHPGGGAQPTRFPHPKHHAHGHGNLHLHRQRDLHPHPDPDHQPHPLHVHALHGGHGLCALCGRGAACRVPVQRPRHLVRHSAVQLLWALRPGCAPGVHPVAVRVRPGLRGDGVQPVCRGLRGHLPPVRAPIPKPCAVANRSGDPVPIPAPELELLPLG